jgi:hypothetical protein
LGYPVPGGNKYRNQLCLIKSGSHKFLSDYICFAVLKITENKSKQKSHFQATVKAACNLDTLINKKVTTSQRSS